MDEAITPADWASLLRWLARSKDPGAKRLLWAYRFGLRSVALPPRQHSGPVRIYAPDHPPPELATEQAEAEVDYARFLGAHPDLAAEVEAARAGYARLGAEAGTNE